jgi:hypothetical protein
MVLRAVLVDPRDVTVEESEPTYRVYFWSEGGGHCREYDVTGADDVEGVTAWADANVQDGEIYILGVRWVETFTPPGSDVRSVPFIRLRGNPSPGQSVGTRRG